MGESVTPEARLAAALSRDLERSVRLAVSDEPLAMSRLSRGEAACLATMSELRRPSWLRGRSALKRLLATLGSDEDTATIAFPHPRLSLTHSGGIAVAVSTECQGTGIDLEGRRRLRPDTACFFLALAERERSALAGADLLRLWTVKEAVFKADVENGGRGLSDYVLADLQCAIGLARRRGGGRAFRYASLDWGRGVLTAAVRCES